MAAIVYVDENARMEAVTLEYSLSEDAANVRLNLSRPEAVIAKALLRLGREGWELASISPEDNTFGQSSWNGAPLEASD